MNLIDKIQAKKEQIADLKERRATLEGRRQSIIERMKDEFGVKNIKEAEDLRKELSNKTSKLNKKIQSDLARLDELLANETDDDEGDYDDDVGQ